MTDTVIYQCANVGVSGTTPVHVKKNDDGNYEARCGFALMGQTQMTEDEFVACGHNPFHPEFYDNYARGYGITEADAIEAMKNSMKAVANSLWAF